MIVKLGTTGSNKEIIFGGRPRRPCIVPSPSLRAVIHSFTSEDVCLVSTRPVWSELTRLPKPRIIFTRLRPFFFQKIIIHCWHGCDANARDKRTQPEGLRLVLLTSTNAFFGYIFLCSLAAEWASWEWIIMMARQHSPEAINKTCTMT